MQDTIAHIVAASPVDEILGAINGVFDTVRDVLDFIKKIQSVADRIHELFDALTNADAQLDAWRDGVLAKVQEGANAAIVTALTALNSALDATRHGDVLAAFDAARVTLQTELDALQPATRLNRIVAAYGRIAGRAGTLPASTTKTAVLQALSRFNPANPYMPRHCAWQAIC